MPASLVKAFARKTNKSVADVEKLWDKAKAAAAEQGHKDDYDYIVGILKKMLKLEGVRDTTETVIQAIKVADHPTPVGLRKRVDVAIEKVRSGIDPVLLLAEQKHRYYNLPSSSDAKRVEIMLLNAGYVKGEDYKIEGERVILYNAVEKNADVKKILKKYGAI